MKKIVLSILILSSSLLFAQEKQFKETVLKSTFINLKGEEVPFYEIIEKHHGKKIVLEIWASWCSDCVAAMPKVKELQKKNKEVDFVFISMDKTFEDFQKGVKKHKLIGDHYFSKTPWKKSVFAKNIKLDWIPRYILIDEKGKIALFKAVKPDDKKLIELLK